MSDDFSWRIPLGIPKPKMPEAEEHLLPINEMRALIFATSRDSTFIRELLNCAQHRGYNGEDTMTFIAYRALRLLEDMSEREMVRLMKEPLAPFFVEIPK